MNTLRGQQSAVSCRQCRPGKAEQRLRGPCPAASHEAGQDTPHHSAACLGSWYHATGVGVNTWTTWACKSKTSSGCARVRALALRARCLGHSKHAPFCPAVSVSHISLIRTGSFTLPPFTPVCVTLTSAITNYASCCPQPTMIASKACVCRATQFSGPSLRPVGAAAGRGRCWGLAA